MDKIKAASITLFRAEGPHDRVKEACATSFGEANRILLDWAPSVLKDMGSDVCDFRIVFADGQPYEGFYLLENPQSKGAKPCDLGQHIKRFLEFEGGIAKPAHLTQAQYDRFLLCRGEESQKQCRDFLAAYDLMA